MRIFALQLDNDIKGIAQRKACIESLLAALPEPELVVLPELALCSYMANPAAGIKAYEANKGKPTDA